MSLLYENNRFIICRKTTLGINLSFTRKWCCEEQKEDVKDFWESQGWIVLFSTNYGTIKKLLKL